MRPGWGPRRVIPLSKQFFLVQTRRQFALVMRGVWSAVVGVLMLGVGIYLPAINQAEKAYRSAAICPEANFAETCKQKIPAIVDYVEDTQVVLPNLKYYTASTFRNRSYTLKLASSETLKVELSNWPEFEAPLFSSSQSLILNQKVLVELWRGQATLLIVETDKTNPTVLATTRYPPKLAKEKRDSVVVIVLLVVGFAFSITLGLWIEHLRAGEAGRLR